MKIKKGTTFEHYCITWIVLELLSNGKYKCAILGVDGDYLGNQKTQFKPEIILRYTTKLGRLLYES